MKDTTRPRSETAAGPSSVHYPAKIRLTPGAERYLEQLGQDLLTGDVELTQLSPALLQLYTFAFEQGRASLQPEVDRANADADRLYAEVCRRLPPKDTWQSFTELSRLRGDEERARRAEERAAYIAASIKASNT